MLTYAVLFEWEWEWYSLSCQMGSIVSDVFSAEAGNIYLSSCWKIVTFVAVITAIALQTPEYTFRS